MANPTPEFMQDYQALARQSWDAWMQQLKQAGVPAAMGTPASAATSFGGDTLERTLDGLKGYMQWMQGATAQPSTGDWQKQLQQFFAGGTAPFAPAMGGIDSVGAHGFVQQWQNWLQSAGNAFASVDTPSSPMPAFGLDREQHMQHQAYGQAMLAAAQATTRYQALLQRAAAGGVQRLQEKLAQHAEPGRQIDSLKGLYDVWVDASEDAYAQIALTTEFRTAYGEMVNTQMKVRQLQQKQMEATCQQMGIPTRTEVSSLGERLQALRREMRSGGTGGTGSNGGADQSDAIGALRREVVVLKRQLEASPSAAASAATARTSSTASKAAASNASSGTTASKAAAKSRPVANSKATRTAKSVKAPAKGAKPIKRAPSSSATSRRTPAKKIAATTTKRAQTRKRK